MAKKIQKTAPILAIPHIHYHTSWLKIYYLAASVIFLIPSSILLIVGVIDLLSGQFMEFGTDYLVGLVLCASLFAYHFRKLARTHAGASKTITLGIYYALASLFFIAIFSVSFGLAIFKAIALIDPIFFALQDWQRQAYPSDILASTVTATISAALWFAHFRRLR